jgi:limonene-1,2-epoxide hydrolase
MCISARKRRSHRHERSLTAIVQAFLGSIAAIHHELLDVWEVHDETVITTMNVRYERLDGRETTLPCCNVFRVRDGLIHDYRIYMDINPVFTP